MKKWLSILGAIGLTATSTTTLISCKKPNNNENGNNKPEPTSEPKKPQQPSKDSNWKLMIEGENEKINHNLKTYIGLKLIGKTWFINKWKGKHLKTDTWKIFGYKNIYRWDGVNEPQTPEIDKDTGKITDWKE
ncbi:lipoprotein [Spiroplasma endosymbiont of Ammophila pubescens]|uniref:lipoprotein n=1 Tax=Spiroplasma endosymbiont of Ammophila pubescens TaxID=3066315 RepID=UPI0032B25B99